MSNAALAFLSGLGQGYFQAKDAEDRKARQAKIDQREDDDHQAKVKERQRVDAERSAITQAGQPMVAAANGMSRPAWMDDRDVGLPENAALRNGGLQPTAEAGTAQGRLARQVDALAPLNPERAMAMESSGLTLDNARAEQARKFKDEGIFDALRAFRSGDAATMKQAFNKSGQFKIDGDVKLTPEERDLPGYGKVTTYNATFNAVGPDGKVVPKTYNSHDLSMQMVPYEKALETQLKGAKESREGRKTDAETEESKAKAGYYKAISSERDNKPDKMDEADKMALQSINKQRETINAAITKAQAEGSWDENSPNAMALRKQVAGLGVREQMVMKKYAGEPTVADPVGGLRTPAPAAAAPVAQGSPGTRITPAQQAAADKDRVAILQAELGKAQARAAAGDARAAGDVAALQNELRRTGVMNAAPRPAAAAGYQPPAAAPAAPVAPAKVDPAEAAGQMLDAARAKVRQLQAAAPGLAKGRAAIDQHAQAVQAARAELAAAEAQYQRLVAPQASQAAFVPQRGM